MLEIRLLGQFDVKLDGQPVEIPSRPAQSLLAYLLLNLGTAHRREKLAGLFWPDTTDSNARNNLRYALWRIRKAIEASRTYLIADDRSIAFDASAEYWLDVSVLERKMAEAETAEALIGVVSVYSGELLPGFYDNWAALERERLHSVFERKMQMLLDRLIEGQRWGEVLEWGERWIALGGVPEPAYRALMIAHSGLGDMSKVAAVYNRCIETLHKELGVEPSEQTRTLYEREQIKAGGGGAGELRALPTGTVTFLFTDIEGSTPLWDRDPAAMQESLARHNAILRAAITAHQGQVFKVVGDAFQAAFAAPAPAVLAALAAQRELAAATWGKIGPLRVRMGLHAGPAEVHEGDYAVSHTLNRAARVMSAGHGGQVLLTLAVAELVRGQLPPEVQLKDLGEHYLKGLTQPEQFFQVVAPDMPGDFPPLASQTTSRHNLPLPLTSFIGREQEIAQVEHLLSASRLVTLTGPGGVGKTRLSIRVASEVLADYADGVWYVELAPLANPVFIPPSVARVLGLQEGAGRPVIQILTDYLRGKRLLLVLDNCEHLVAACAQLAEVLLNACPNLKMLASSREALGLAGETAFPVPSLSFPDPRHLPPVGAPADLVSALTQYDAVCLFAERAGAVLPGFAVTPQNAPTLARVCQQLDGIPLAIELAAARVKMLRVEQIAARLDDRFRLLTGGSRTALPRHQTLRAMIDWSYDLLSEAERTLLRRLSVFAGGWTLEAAEAVGAEAVGADPRVGPAQVGPGIGQGADTPVSPYNVLDNVLDLLTQLANKSLVVVERKQGAETRYRLLETIRQYAREKLWAAGAGEPVRERHLAYFLNLAEHAELELRGPDQVEWLDRLEVELDNIRAALEWALESDIETALRLAAALLWLWHIRGHKSEGCDWLERALSIEAMERSDQPLSPARALSRGKALNVAGFLLTLLGNFEKAAALSEEALALFRKLGLAGQRGMAYALLNLGEAAGGQMDPRRAQALVEESLALFREVGDKFGMAQCFDILTSTEDDYDRARAFLEEGLALRKEIGDKDGIAIAFWGLGATALSRGDYRRATTMYEESLALFREVGNKWLVSWLISGLGDVAWAQGDYKQAARQYEEALALGQDVGDKWTTSHALYRLAELARSQGDYAQLARKYDEALTLAREEGDKSSISAILYSLGAVALAQGNDGQAARRFEEALALGRMIGNKFTIALGLSGLGKVAQARGDPASARSLHVEALSIRREAGEQWGMAHSLVSLAVLATAQQHVEPSPLRFRVAPLKRSERGEGLRRAAQLLGAAEALPKVARLTWFSLTPLERAHDERIVAELRAQLGEAAFAKAWEEGRAMTLEQAVEYALEGLAADRFA